MKSRKIFHHAVYDGVYATPEERNHDRGCLSLLNHLADWYDVEQAEITGLCDMGHKLQLVYGDGMMNNKKVKELNTPVFGTMSDFLHGQTSLKFKEISQELKHPTLSNKGSQEIRWVRADLTAFQTFFRNLPTLHTLTGREESSYAESGDITCQKSMEKKREELSRGETIAFAVCITQLLDCYSIASINARYLPFFQTTVIKSALQMQKNLQLWKNNWTQGECL